VQGRLAAWLKPIERYVLGPDGKPQIGPDGQPLISKTSIRQELGNQSNTLATIMAGQDPQAIADAVVQAVQALPATDAQQVADLVIAGLGQRINTPPAAA
jgi:hypothetical protein